MDFKSESKLYDTAHRIDGGSCRKGSITSVQFLTMNTGETLAKRIEKCLLE
jgi:hypothetical protein